MKGKQAETPTSFANREPNLTWIRTGYTKIHRPHLRAIIESPSTC